MAVEKEDFEALETFDRELKKLDNKFQEEWDEALAYLRAKHIYRPGLFEIYDTVEKLRLAKSMVSPKRCPGKDYG